MRCLLLPWVSRSVVSNSLWRHGLQHSRLSVLHALSEFAKIHVHGVSDAIWPSRPLLPPPTALSLSQHQGLSQWVDSSPSGGQSIGASALFLPMNIQGWFPLELTGLISMQSKGLSRVLSTTTVRKHQFFGAQPSLWPTCHIRTGLLDTTRLWSMKRVSCLQLIKVGCWVFWECRVGLSNSD